MDWGESRGWGLAARVSRREAGEERDARRLGFSTACGMGLIYNRHEMTILPIEFDEITTPATAEKNGRPRSYQMSIERPKFAKL